MEAKVIKPFTDKYRAREYQKNDVFEHNEKKRIDELVKAGYLEVKPKTNSKSSR